MPKAVNNSRYWAEETTGHPAEDPGGPERASHGIRGVRGPAPAEVVESLQELLGITVAGEVTTRVRAVADLQGAARALAVAPPVRDDPKDPNP
ncbi:hypothetical protein ACFVT1_17925 [Streptomyces sp. NPDC057963]|uniref:hypothetical protein n=1 Tax=Streptomyces sp. NPDC057963 TaxID=3346290 RepID=UPI0036E190CC